MNSRKGKYMKHTSFPWPPLETSLLKTIFEKKLMKKHRRLPLVPNPKLSKTVYLEKTCSTVL